MQYVAFDYLCWVLAAYFVARLINSGNPRWWIAVGCALGLGMLTKYSILFLIAGIVVGVDHLQMARQLVHHVVKIAGEEGMAGIRTRADVDRAHRAQDPKDVTGAAEQKMRQFIFQNATDAKFAAVLRDLVQRGGRILHSLETFGAG